MKKIYKKLGTFGLACIMIFNLLPMKVYANVNSGKIMYHLENETFDEMIASGFWEVEHIEKNNASAPEVVDGKIKMETKDSIGFQWMNLLGEETYSFDCSYIFDFDFKITDSGNGFLWDNGAHTRVLYVAFGGYYNQIEVNNMSGKVRAGETYLDYDSLTYENKKMHGQVILEGTTVTSTISDEYGNVIATGSRTNDAFADMDDHNKCMTYLVLRCEDGAVEIDDFNFSMKYTETISTTPFNNKEGSKVEYTACLNYKEKEKTVMKLGNTNLFSLEDNVMKICGNAVTGTYGVGIYEVKVEISPLQQILKVEIILPDGGTVRRGYGSIPVGEVFSWKSTPQGEKTVANRVNNESIQYKLVELNDYELNTKEPEGDEFSQKVYNIVQSFEDAHNTRLFAWTVKTSFFQNGDKMILRYRGKGDGDWSLVEAQKQEEPSKVSEEDYYKVDLDNLVAGKEYEYQIGVKSVNQEDVWSNIYTFKTASEDLSEFKFVAIGDTQGVSWEGNTPATKGYMYAMAALDQAMKEVDEPSFILHTGDVTELGNTLSMWNHYFKAVGEYTKKIPHFATVGNHDTWANDNNNYFSFHFNHPDNGKDALDQSYGDKITNANLKVQFTENEDTIYSYNYGDAHFVVLHSGSYIAEDEYFLEAQRQWLIRDLEENKDAKWKVVLVHEPVYHRKGGGEDRPWLFDVIESYGVDLVIQGHSHLVTRTYPMKDGAIVTKKSPDVVKKGEGTVYTTVGSTTLDHDSMGNPNMEKCMLIMSPENTQASYAIVSVEEDSLTMTVKQLNGYVLDQFEIVVDEDTKLPTPEHKHSYTPKVKEPTCEDKGYTTYTCECGDSFVSDSVSALGHIEVVDKAVVATCTQTGLTEGKHCSRCSTVLVKQETVKMLNHEFKNYVSDNNATAEKDGTKTAKCERCDATDTIIDEGSKLPMPEHKHSYSGKVTEPTCTKEGYTTYTCECGDSYKADETVKLGHKFVNYVSNNDATTEQDGTKTAKCERCDATDTIVDEGSKLPKPQEPTKPTVTDTTRVFGASRYETAFKTADTLKATLGVDKFDTAIVANGTNFADALAGSYLAAKKSAPILMTDKNAKNITNLVNYIKANVKPGGTVYILGGYAALPNSIDKGLAGYKVERLAGADRYETNLLILDAAGVTNEAILVATGTGFADSLSASATGLPMLLVNKELNPKQKAFLEAHRNNTKYIVGGTSAVSAKVEQQVAVYGKPERLAGNGRYDTSVMVAKEFFSNPTSAVVAYGRNFPDGLSGGPLAYAIGGPLLLAENNAVKTIDAYTEEVGIASGYVLGGSGLVSDSSVKTMFNSKKVK